MPFRFDPLMSFRHTFAVSCMRRWYEPGQDVQALLPHLSVYVGHIRPQESYGYFTAVRELLGAEHSDSRPTRSQEAPTMPARWYPISRRSLPIISAGRNG